MNRRVLQAFGLAFLVGLICAQAQSPVGDTSGSGVYTGTNDFIYIRFSAADGGRAVVNSLAVRDTASILYEVVSAEDAGVIIANRIAARELVAGGVVDAGMLMLGNGSPKISAANSRNVTIAHPDAVAEHSLILSTDNTAGVPTLFSGGTRLIIANQGNPSSVWQPGVTIKSSANSIGGTAIEVGSNSVAAGTAETFEYAHAFNVCIDLDDGIIGRSCRLKVSQGGRLDFQFVDDAANCGNRTATAPSGRNCIANGASAAVISHVRVDDVTWPQIGQVGVNTTCPLLAVSAVNDGGFTVTGYATTGTPTNCTGAAYFNWTIMNHRLLDAGTGG